MLQSIRLKVARHLVNFRGWDTDRKIVVIESDDWGSIRMPSKQVYDAFLERGVALEKSPYCRYDSLAGEEDLETLFNALYKFRDHKGNHPVITANTITANPDFDKIKQADFREYVLEPFTRTLKRYPGREKSFELWKQGMEAGLFRPQFHGREHLNIPLWMRLLQSDNPIFMEAFDHRMWGIDMIPHQEDPLNILAAFDTNFREEVQFQKEAVREGISLFRTIFGFIPQSFIAPNYIWDSELHGTLKRSGIHFLQGMKMQRLPIYGRKKRAMIRHYTGEMNENGQVYLVRNCVFEPSLKTNQSDNVGSCLKDISVAFEWNKPAIITSHRLNFIGAIDPGNRQHNLKQLEELLSKILKQWPDAEFMSTDRLGAEILKRSN